MLNDNQNGKGEEMKTRMGKCPECGGEVEIYGDMEKGDIIDCDECGIELEITSLKPIKLVDASDDEDYEDEDEDDD